jgi:hypothetical protein
MAAGINDTFRQVGVAVGIAVWAAIFVGRGEDKVSEVAAGTPGATGERPRELVEAASSGTLDQALAAIPADDRQTVTEAAGEGFLAGLNDVLTLAALVSFAGALLALWLVREREIEREPRERMEATAGFEAADSGARADTADLGALSDYARKTAASGLWDPAPARRLRDP